MPGCRRARRFRFRARTVYLAQETGAFNPVIAENFTRAVKICTAAVAKKIASRFQRLTTRDSASRHEHHLALYRPALQVGQEIAKAALLEFAPGLQHRLVGGADDRRQSSHKVPAARGIRTMDHAVEGARKARKALARAAAMTLTAWDNGPPKKCARGDEDL